MQRIVLPPLERRLQERYRKLVISHMQSAPKLAAGVRSLPELTTTAFAATQAAWRFLNNANVTLEALVEPLRQVARETSANLNAPFVLLVHDWCKLSFTEKKKDEVRLTHKTDVGYDLTTALLVNPENGAPIAPMEMHLRIKRRVLSTRDPAPKHRPHLEQVLPTMQASLTWGLAQPVLHVIDREADSVDHYRRWDDAGHRFLIRADDRRVRHEGRSKLLSEILQNLQENQAFEHVGEAKYEGRSQELWVAETAVVLHRPAKKNVKGVRSDKPGRALPLRLIAVQVRHQSGRVLAEWKLLSNAPLEWSDAAGLAQNYYWRWRIETFFKLLKSQGLHLEQWGQQTGPAIARRLLIASMACVVVWDLQSRDDQAAEDLKDILIRLSGRQMKAGQPHTASALLAGLWSLLSMLELLKHCTLENLQDLAANFTPFNTG